jgi:tRNA 2-selenouridine synthase
VVLQGGYKAYRNALLKLFEEPLPLIVVAGCTGSKKTSLLHHLRDRGAQVVDLEGLARHQGSSYGNQKAGNGQPTSEHFQNLLFECFRSLDLTRPIFLEDESIRIGQVNLPDALFRRMNESAHVVIEAERAQRIEYLVEDYGQLAPEKLIAATEAIRKKLGHEKAVQAIGMIKEGRLSEAVDIILTYYDGRYEAALSRRTHLVKKRVKVDLNNLEGVAAALVNDAETIVNRHQRTGIA